MTSAELAQTRPEPLPLATSTVVICAYTMKRWANIVDAVRSVIDQLADADECLVVVDHNDELHDKAVVEFAPLPSVRVLASTGEQGLSGARNTAVAAARGQIVAFLDDDAAAESGWLPKMRAELSMPDVYGVGTWVRAAWPDGQRPRWFPPEYDWVVGCSYLGQPTERTDVRNVIGAAMAFRREVFDLAGDFSTTVGRVGTAPTGCEETELCIRLRQRRTGARIRHLPDVAVAHTVTPDRLKVRYFFRRCVGEGQSKARVSRLVGASDGLSSERAYTASVLPRGVIRELKRGIRGDLSGFAAASLIIVGVILAGFGYVEGRLLRRSI